MATKQIEMNRALNGEGCLGKAHPDEPVFILRAQDAHADYVVRRWAEAAAVTLGWNHPKVVEAMQLADSMEVWPNRKLPD
jgi:hypothetical protein